MAKDFWITADTHFGHANALKFKREDGSPLRDFPGVDAMDEYMIARWNERVKPGDYVYHLGDVIFDMRKLDMIMSRLNGKKRLILGNHDPLKGNKLSQYFDKVEVWKRFDQFGIVATHLPLHESALAVKYTRNVHGHIHAMDLKSPRHLCVSVERTGYAPVNVDELDGMFKKKGWIDASQRP
jgi:calcineurin-like phosphoesterase family protein